MVTVAWRAAIAVWKGMMGMHVRGGWASGTAWPRGLQTLLQTPGDGETNTQPLWRAGLKGGALHLQLPPQMPSVFILLFVILLKNTVNLLTYLYSLYLQIGDVAQKENDLP